MLLSKMTQKTFSTLEKTASSDSEKLEETSYLDSLNQNLTGKNAYLLVRKDDDVFYCGAQTQDELLFSELPEYGDASAGNDRASISVLMCSPLSNRWILPLQTVQKAVHLSSFIRIPWFRS